MLWVLLSSCLNNIQSYAHVVHRLSCSNESVLICMVLSGSHVHRKRTTLKCVYFATDTCTPSAQTCTLRQSSFSDNVWLIISEHNHVSPQLKHLSCPSYAPFPIRKGALATESQFEKCRSNALSNIERLAQPRFRSRCSFFE